MASRSRPSSSLRPMAVRAEASAAAARPWVSSARAWRRLSSSPRALAAAWAAASISSRTCSTTLPASVAAIAAGSSRSEAMVLVRTTSEARRAPWRTQ